MNESPVFIVGCRRSGTTLMLNTLNRNSKVGLFPGETHFFDRVLDEIEVFDESNKDVIVDVLDEKSWIADVPGKDQLELDAVVDQVFADLEYTVSGKEFFKSFLMEVAKSDGSQVWGGKTPTHVYYVDEMKGWYPDARVIQIIRDPRAVVASHIYRLMKRKHSDFDPYFGYLSHGLPHIIYRWRKSTRLSFEYANRYPDDFMMIKFEDLLDNPKVYLRNVCDFLRIPFEEEMLKLSVYHSSFETKGRKGFDLSAKYSWKRKNPWWANRLVELMCNDYMQRLNYTL